MMEPAGRYGTTYNPWGTAHYWECLREPGTPEPQGRAPAKGVEYIGFEMRVYYTFQRIV